MAGQSSSTSKSGGRNDEKGVNEASSPTIQKKARKPYTITKSRETWSEVEHEKFLEALQLFDRDWKKIEAFVGTKTVIQIRSHAQKHFLKLQKNGTSDKIPPPRPKRKSTAPQLQSQKSARSPSTAGDGDEPGAPALSASSQPASSAFQSPSAASSRGCQTAPATPHSPIPSSLAHTLPSHGLVGPAAVLGPFPTPSLLPGRGLMPTPSVEPSLMGSEEGPLSLAGPWLQAQREAVTSGLMSTKMGNEADVQGARQQDDMEDGGKEGKADVPAHLSGKGAGRRTGSPDFAEVYSYISSVFDSEDSCASDRLQVMFPVDRETTVMLMNNLSVNLASCDLDSLMSLLDCEAATMQEDRAGGEVQADGGSDALKPQGPAGVAMSAGAGGLSSDQGPHVGLQRSAAAGPAGPAAPGSPTGVPQRVQATSCGPAMPALSARQSLSLMQRSVSTPSPAHRQLLAQQQRAAQQQQQQQQPQLAGSAQGAAAGSGVPGVAALPGLTALPGTSVVPLGGGGSEGQRRNGEMAGGGGSAQRQQEHLVAQAGEAHHKALVQRRQMLLRHGQQQLLALQEQERQLRLQLQQHQQQQLMPQALPALQSGLQAGGPPGGANLRLRGLPGEGGSGLSGMSAGPSDSDLFALDAAFSSSALSSAEAQMMQQLLREPSPQSARAQAMLANMAHANTPPLPEGLAARYGPMAVGAQAAAASALAHGRKVQTEGRAYAGAAWQAQRPGQADIMQAQAGGLAPVRAATFPGQGFPGGLPGASFPGPAGPAALQAAFGGAGREEEAMAGFLRRGPHVPLRSASQSSSGGLPFNAGLGSSFLPQLNEVSDFGLGQDINMLRRSDMFSSPPLSDARIASSFGRGMANSSHPGSSLTWDSGTPLFE